MSRSMVVLAASIALTVLAACSKSGHPPAERTSSPRVSGPAPGPTDYGTATEPGPGKLKLDITVGSGEAIYGDPENGKQVFNSCVACHATDPGVNRVGPSLHGIIGRHSGVVPGFHYSDANKSSGLVWTEQELYAYLQNPQKTVPGTYMTFTGVKDPQKRADVIAYLQENTK